MIPLQNVLAFTTSKGGVGKTSLSTNFAGILAHSWNQDESQERRILLVDLDPQANTLDDLGVREREDIVADDGQGLLHAVVTKGGVPPFIARDVRPHLDLIPAGTATEKLHIYLTINGDDPTEAMVFYELLRSLSDEYDMIVIDLPPINSYPLVRAAYAAASDLVIPTKSDSGSILGLHTTSEKFWDIKTRFNPTLEVLGVVLFAQEANATVINKEVRVELNDKLSNEVIVFDTAIRHSARAARDTRITGLLAHEYLDAGQHVEPWYKAVARGEKPERSVAANASGLAGDYLNLTVEILARKAERDQARGWID